MVKEMISEISSVLYKNRYCTDDAFSLVIDGSDRFDIKVRDIYMGNFTNSAKKLESISQISIAATVSIGLDVYTFDDGENAEIKIMSKTNNCTHYLVETEEDSYCVCPFMKNLYLLGGLEIPTALRTCWMYETGNKKWVKISDMNFCRSAAACTVFEGKIVVSGGRTRDNYGLPTVESYDHHENKWTNLPKMIIGRYDHGAVSMGNKMFVIGGRSLLSCEVFDSISRIFSYIKEIENIKSFHLGSSPAVINGEKILVYPNVTNYKNRKVHIYDVVKNRWYWEENEIKSLKYVISLTKIPIV